jgi:predicted metal-dependent TIM-barrel fold hydrolase
VLRSDRRIRPERCIIDHVEEHTIQMVLEAGFWAGMTLYPERSAPPRGLSIWLSVMVRNGVDEQRLRLGVSVPLAVPYAALELRRRGHTSEGVDKMIYQNPLTFLSQCPNFVLPGQK